MLERGSVIGDWTSTRVGRTEAGALSLNSPVFLIIKLRCCLGLPLPIITHEASCHLSIPTPFPAGISNNDDDDNDNNKDYKIINNNNNNNNNNNKNRSCFAVYLFLCDSIFRTYKLQIRTSVLMTCRIIKHTGFLHLHANCNRLTLVWCLGSWHPTCEGSGVKPQVTQVSYVFGTANSVPL